MQINTKILELLYDKDSLPIKLTGANVAYSIYLDDNMGYISGSFILDAVADNLDIANMTGNDIGRVALQKLKNISADFRIPQESPHNVSADNPTETSITIGGE